MRRKLKRMMDGPKGGTYTVLGIVSAAFFVGLLAGCLLASKVGGGGTDSLTMYLNQYIQEIAGGELESPRILPLLWETFRWPVLAVFLGLTPLGMAAVPALFLLRGFLFAFSIGSLYRMLAGTGLLLSFLLSGVTGLIGIPVLFVLGVQSMLSARMLTGRGNPYGRLYFARLAICGAALCVCVLMERFVVPALLLASASGLTG